MSTTPGRGVPAHLSVVPGRPGESVPGSPGAAPGARGKPAARRRNRIWFRLISPLAVLAGWQLVSMSG